MGDWVKRVGRGFMGVGFGGGGVMEGVMGKEGFD